MTRPPSPADPVAVGPGPVSFADVVAVARAGAAVSLTPEAESAIERARAVVEELAAGATPAYGISTGFGALATRHIPTDRRAQLQRSLVRSHAAGSGPEVEAEVVRALMLLRLSTLATGHTGIRLGTARLIADLLSARITPVVHEYGSLGCSGDLAPLSHCALALMGEGEVRDAGGDAGGRGRRRSPPPGWRRSSWPPRRASPSSTAPTACSACWCWRSRTCGCCSVRPTSPPR